MTPDKIYHLVQADDITLAFDTSVTIRRGFLDLCDQANWINERRKALGLPNRIHLSVPAVAHTERMFDLAQTYGSNYKPEIIRRTLSQRHIIVPEFTRADAEQCAKLLMKRYDTTHKWHTFKKQRCLECVGLPEEHHHLAQGTGQQCGAPNDWLIIAQASREKTLLVMDDLGRSKEYELITNKVRYTDVQETLSKILTKLTEQPQ